MTNSITGYFKALKQNYLVTNTVTLTASTGTATIENIKDFDKETAWSSVGSNDTVKETIDIVFTSAVTVDRLVLLQMNFKYFGVFFWDGGQWKNFTGVHSVLSPATVPGAIYGTDVYGTGTYGFTPSNGAVYGTSKYGSAIYAEPGAGIQETENNDTSKYYEFSLVTTTKIRIEVLRTITPDAQKELVELYIGKEIGTFVDDITSSPNAYQPVLSDARAIYLTKSNGGTVKYVRGSKYFASVELNQMLYTSDQNIINTLYDDGQFAILPCGAVPYAQEGWRLQDFFNVVIKGNQEAIFSVGRVADMGMSYVFELLEQ